MKMRPYVSVIVPVYNVESYLSKCLDSLIAQTLRNIEIVIINDGSTDGSDEVIARYAQDDERIRVIHQPNRGLSGARNTGLEQATGEYVSFVDSDDWVDVTMLERMYHKAVQDGSDVCASDYYLAYGHQYQERQLKVKEEKLNLEQFGVDRFWLDNRHGRIVWNKIYRRSLLDAHGIRFELNSEVFSEDVLFNLYVLAHVRQVSGVSDSLYYYYQRSDSIMSKPKPHYVEREMKLVDKFVAYSHHYSDQQVPQVIARRLLFDRLINISMQTLQEGQGIIAVRNAIVQVSRHPLYANSMAAMAKDRGVWMPMRMYAKICRWGGFSWLGASYLWLFQQASLIKKRLRGGGNPGHSILMAAAEA